MCLGIPPTGTAEKVYRRQGPAGIPSAIATYQSSDISTACSCLSIPTPSTTTTNTITTTSTQTQVSSIAATTTTTPTTTIIAYYTSTSDVCPTPTPCGNSGLDWATFSNTQGDNDDGVYSQFDPSVYMTERPSRRGTTNVIGGFSIDQEGGYQPYGSHPGILSAYFALLHRGYIFAQYTGNYTFSILAADDVAGIVSRIHSHKLRTSSGSIFTILIIGSWLFT